MSANENHVKKVVRKNVSHAQKNNRSVVDSTIEIRDGVSENETETENETDKISFLSKLNLSLDANGDPETYISDIGKLVQSRLEENVIKRTFSDLTHKDYMRTGHQYENIVCFEFETETKSDEDSDIFSLEVERLNRIQVEVGKTTEKTFDIHKPSVLFPPDRAGSKISESGSVISPIETGPNQNQNDQELSTSFSVTAFETCKNHDNDDVCSKVIVKDVALSAVDVKIDGKNALTVSECNLDLHTQSHLHLTLSTTENKGNIQCGKKELTIDNTIQNHSGADNKGKKCFLSSQIIDNSPQNVRLDPNFVNLTSKEIAHEPSPNISTSVEKAVSKDQIKYEALGAIPKIRKLGKNMDSEAEKIGTKADRYKAIGRILNSKAVNRIPETISNNIESCHRSISTISTIFDLPKLELKQPSITGYLEKTAENEVKLEPILQPKESIGTPGEVNISEHLINIDNIECESDQYPDKILGLDHQNIAKKSAQKPKCPPGIKLKWESFSDIVAEKALVRLPNLTTTKSQSQRPSKKPEMKRRGRLTKKEVEMNRRCMNSISNYFPMTDVSKNHYGKRKSQSPISEKSKKIRVGKSD